MKAEPFVIQNYHPSETDTFQGTVKAIKYKLTLLLHNDYRGFSSLGLLIFAIQKLHKTSIEPSSSN